MTKKPCPQDYDDPISYDLALAKWESRRAMRLQKVLMCIFICISVAANIGTMAFMIANMLKH